MGTPKRICSQTFRGLMDLIDSAAAMTTRSARTPRTNENIVSFAPQCRTSRVGMTIRSLTSEDKLLVKQYGIRNAVIGAATPIPNSANSLARNENLRLRFEAA